MTTVKSMLLAGLAGSALIASAAYAEDTVPSTVEAKARDAGTDAADNGNAIVVTGSRIARPELESAMPVSVARFDELSRLGRVNAYDALRLEPSIAPGAGAYSANFYDGTGDAGNAGAAFINLRNLGASRTLTLVDGRRRVSGTAAASAVDINMIPSAMIDRIEVVTGGAAAIYGADAVTGAVNIITKKDLKGLYLSAYQGISQEGDAPETNISLTAGGKFAEDRGSFSIGATYLKTGGVQEHARKFSRSNITFWANPKNTGVNDGIPDNITINGLLLFYNSEVPMMYVANNNGYYHISNGQAIRSFYDLPLGTGETARGYGTSNPQFTRSYNYYAPLRLAEETFSTIARFDYELLDGVTYGARLDYGRTNSSGIETRYREDSRTLFAGGNGGARAYLDNPYMPTSVRSILTGFGLTSAPIDRWYTNWPHVETLHDRENLAIGQNLTGKIGSTINWEAFYQYSRTKDDVTVTNVPLTARWIASRDVVAVNGQPACRDVTARAAGCVPYNIFGNDPLTAAQEAWMLTDLRSQTANKQEIFGASMNGKLFALPYGDVSFAAGVEHRTDTGRLTPDPRVVAPRQVPLDGFVASIPTSAVDASLKVSEVYGELVVPLLRDLPFVRRLEVEAAYRYSDYKAIGSTDTWKAGATWSPIDGLTIRGVRSRSVRVPNFGELYAPVNVGITGSINDPCLAGNYNLTPTRAANCQALGVPNNLAFYSTDVAVRSGGNPNLKPEISDSYTIGVVMQPRFIRGLDVTVDYWNIRIKDAVTSFDLATTYNQCVDLPTTDNVFCSNIQRDPVTHKISFVSTQMVNAARLAARGIDVGVNYRLPLWGGQLSFNLKGSYLLQRKVENIPGVAAAIIKYAGSYTDPRFRGYLLTSYNVGDYGISIGTQFIGAAMQDPNAIPGQYDNNHIPSRTYNDISLSRRFDDKFDITLGVKNALNVEPPLLPNVYNGGAGRYDTIGRSFFVKAGAKF